MPQFCVFDYFRITTHLSIMRQLHQLTKMCLSFSFFLLHSVPYELKFIKTPWATACLVINDYMYNCHSKRGKRDYWRCHNYSKRDVDARCRARCVVLNGVLKSLTGGPHNHLPHTEKIARIERRNVETIESNNLEGAEHKIDFSFVGL